MSKTEESAVSAAVAECLWVPSSELEKAREQLEQTKTRTLSPDECKSVKDAIVAYVKSGPSLGGDPAAAPAAAAAAPAPAKK
jgi:hypothetical protein